MLEVPISLSRGIGSSNPALFHDETIRVPFILTMNKTTLVKTLAISWQKLIKSEENINLSTQKNGKDKKRKTKPKSNTFKESMQYWIKQNKHSLLSNICRKNNLKDQRPIIVK